MKDLTPTARARSDAHLLGHTRRRHDTQAEISLVLRQAAWKDKSKLLEMITKLARLNGDIAEIDLRALVDLLKSDLPWLRLIVAEVDGVLVGYAGLVGGMRLQHGQRTMDLHHLYVEESHRGLGVGRALIDRARLTALAQGCAQLTVSTQAGNLDAQAAYKACGFAPQTAQSKRFTMALA